MTIRSRSFAAALAVAAIGLTACSDNTISPLEPKAPVSASVDSAKQLVPTIPWANVNSAVPTIPWADVKSAVPTIPWN